MLELEDHSIHLIGAHYPETYSLTARSRQNPNHYLDVNLCAYWNCIKNEIWILINLILN